MSAIRVEISPVKLRRARGTRTQSDVAKAIGASRQHIWQIETGRITPRGDLLARLCLLYGVGIDDLTVLSNGRRKAA